MSSTMNTIAVVNGYGLVEVVNNKDADAPEPDDSRFTVVCDPINGTNGPCFIVNACARSISYQNVFNDLTHVNIRSRNGIDTVGHTVPGESARIAGHPDMLWSDRYTNGMETVTKCIEAGTWTCGAMIIDVPNDCEWTRALATLEEHGPVDNVENVTHILMRDDGPRMGEFMRDGQRCFMLSDLNAPISPSRSLIIFWLSLAIATCRCGRYGQHVLRIRNSR